MNASPNVHSRSDSVYDQPAKWRVERFSTTPCFRCLSLYILSGILSRGISITILTAGDSSTFLLTPLPTLPTLTTVPSNQDEGVRPAPRRLRFHPRGPCARRISCSNSHLCGEFPTARSLQITHEECRRTVSLQRFPYRAARPPISHAYVRIQPS